MVKMSTDFQDETKITLKDPLVWIDLEMTGLDISKEQIIEIAVVITDGKLLKKIRGPNLVIQCDERILGNMSKWCIKTHKKSGLT